jgi:hypothetical protein
VELKWNWTPGAAELERNWSPAGAELAISHFDQQTYWQIVLPDNERLLQVIDQCFQVFEL